MKEALKLALEALDMMVVPRGFQAQVRIKEIYDTIKEALAQPEQRSVSEHLEPVGVVALIDGKKVGVIYDYSVKIDSDLYTTPPHSFFEDVANELRVEIAELQDHIRLLEKQLAQPEHLFTSFIGGEHKELMYPFTQSNQEFMNDREKLKLAYGNTWSAGSEYPIPSFDDVVSFVEKLKDIELALMHPLVPTAQPEQEPAGVFREDDDIGHVVLVPHQQAALKDGDKLYTTPPQRTWAGLTDEEIDTWNIVGHETLREFVRAIEAKLRSKNENRMG